MFLEQFSAEAPMSCAPMATHSSAATRTRGTEARRSKVIMTGPEDHEMDSQIPYSQKPHVVRHRRPVALPAGLHGLMPVS